MRTRYLVLGVLGIIGVVLYVDRICISVALPAIQKELEIEPERLGWISFANMFATCIDVGGLHAGTVAGTMNTAGQLGGALSALAFGYLVKLGDSYDTPIYVMAGAEALGALAWLLIDAGRPLVPED